MAFVLNAFAGLISYITGITVSGNHLVFLVALLMSLVGSVIFKYVVNTPKFSIQKRLLYTLILGLYLFYYCWGLNVIFAICEAGVCYFLLKVFSPKVSHRYTFAVAMFMLSFCHIKNSYFNPIYDSKESDGYSVDHTGPMMVLTQRITSLSFSLYDGFGRKESDLNQTQKKLAVRQVPSALEYFAYLFNCFGILAGPFVFYNDYISCFFQEKSEIQKKKKVPDSSIPVLVKLSVGIALIVLYWLGDQALPCSLITDPMYIEVTSLWSRALFIYAALFIARSKYYGVWLLGEASHNAAGIGFNGYDDYGSARWDSVSNINIPKIEFATGIKTYIDNWNIGTTVWIRYVAYERLDPKFKMVGSFLLSAVWHGFLPGYYLMFFTCHIFVLVQRKVRRAIRPMFQTSPYSKIFYELVTFLFTQFSIVYGVVPFVLLEWNLSIQFYKSVWFIGHFIGVALLLIVPKKVTILKENSEEPNSVKESHVAERMHGPSEKLINSQFYKVSGGNGHYKLRHR